MIISDYIHFEKPIEWDGKTGQLHTKVNFSNYWLSIQGSVVHECEPKENLPIDEYESYEIAISKKRMFGEIFFMPEVFEGMARYKELLSHFKYIDDEPIGIKVPKSLVADVFEYLLGNWRVRKWDEPVVLPDWMEKMLADREEYLN